MIANRDAKIICEIAALSMCSYFCFRKIIGLYEKDRVLSIAVVPGF